MPRGMQAGVPLGFVYKQYLPRPASIQPCLLTTIYLYTTDRKENCVLRHLQRDLASKDSRCKRLNIETNDEKSQAIYYYRRHRTVEAHLALTGGNISFLNHIKYLGVIFDRRITRRIHIEPKAFRRFIRGYPFFKSERLSANIKLTPHKTLIRSIMTYAYSACEFAAGTCLLKLQRLQNKIHCTTCNFPRCTHVHEMQAVFKILYVYDFFTKNYARSKHKSHKITKIVYLQH